MCGLLFSQMLTLSMPVAYLYLDRFRLWCRARYASFRSLRT